MLPASRDLGRSVTRAPLRLRLGPAPGSLLYLALLAATTTVFALSDERSRAELLLSSSTNLHHLSARPLLVLVASAFWTPGWSFLFWALVLVFVSVPVERRLGTRRWLAVFVTGHVGATVLTVAGVSAAIALGTVDGRVSNAPDVGVSYGMGAVATVFVLGLPRRLARPILAGLVIAVAAFLLSGRTFTDYGHVFSVAIGAVLWLHGIGRPAGSPRLRTRLRSRRGAALVLAEVTAFLVVLAVSTVYQRSPLETPPAHHAGAGSEPAAVTPAGARKGLRSS